MEIGETLYVSERADWRVWLAANHASKAEIWLVLPNKSSGKPSLLYNDAVEEALCFGWIDSIKKSLDPHHAVQRYTPRNPKSGYSQQNRERLRWLAEHDLLLPEVLVSVRDVLAEEFIFPEDILAVLKANPEVWAFYQNTSPAYQRIRIAYIDGARSRPEIYEKRLNSLIRACERGKLIGYGGINKYF